MTMYEVQPRDTLSKIARQFNTTVDKLVQTNNIKNPDLIQIGQVLAIPEESVDVKWKTFQECVKAIERLPEFEDLMKVM